MMTIYSFDAVEPDNLKQAYGNLEKARLLIAETINLTGGNCYPDTYHCMEEMARTLGILMSSLAQAYGYYHCEQT